MSEPQNDAGMSEAELDILETLAKTAAQGNWKAFNMVNMDGSVMSADDLGLYVKNSVLKTASDQHTKVERFLFISTEGADEPDICHIGNGPMGPANAAFIEAARPLEVQRLINTIRQLRTKLASARETAWNEALDKAMVVLREAWHRHAPPFHKRIETQEAMVADMLNSTYALKPQEPKL